LCRKIEEKKLEKERNNTRSNREPNPSNKVLILSLIGGTLLVGFIITFIVKNRLKKRKKTP
jgi:hypothetical protein